MVDVRDEIRRRWDADASGYDAGGDHEARTAEEVAAWLGALSRLLPARPARVLDVGAGTGFLSLLAARLGYDVTALDLSGRMLERLGDKAAAHGLTITTVQASADEPPPGGPYDAVVQRHLLWTLPDPDRALRAWRLAAPTGRVVLVESLWGRAARGGERARAQARHWLHRLRRAPTGHHSHYRTDVLGALPLAMGTPLEELIRLVEGAGWGPARLERLHAVDWTNTRRLPLPERWLGVAPRVAVWAEQTRQVEPVGNR